MANATPDRIGQVNGAGNVDALFLKQFGGEIMGIFQNALVAVPRHVQRNITGGKTAQFPAYGTVNANYHTVGVELVGQTMNHAERTISVDDFLVADIFLAQIDDLMNHYEVRGPYSSELGYALANKIDKQLLQTVTNAARASATVTGGSAGTVITNATAGTSASSLVTSFFTAAQTADEKNLPSEGRQMFLKPAQFYLLAQSTSLQSRDYSSTPGDVAKGVPTPELAGFEIVKTNNVPSTNIATGPTAYQGNFSTTVAIGSHMSAAGTVSLLGVTPEISWDPRRLGYLITARTSVGHGILRPESGFEIKSA